MLGAVGALALLGQALAGEDAVTLEAIEVRVQPAATLTAPDAATAASALRTIPGNVSLIPAPAYRDNAVLGLRDALSLSAGVYVQNPAGQEASKLSLRGSGISTAFAMRGVRLLRDGLPLSRVDGYADTSWADPYNASHIEVYRGANALRYGVSALGGAINLVSPTGHSHPRSELRFEAGSHGHLRAQARNGQAWDNGLDTYVSATEFQTRGSRDHARQAVTRFYGNLGYRYSATSEGRAHLSIERNNQRFPGALTLAQLQDDPHQASASAIRTGERVNLWPRVNLAYQHVWRSDAGHTVQLGAYYSVTRFDYPNANLRLTYDAREYGISLRQEVEYRLAGHASRLAWGLNLGRGRNHNQTFGPVYLGELTLDPGDDQFEDIHGTHATHEFFFENRWQATPRLSLVAGAQWVHATRGGQRRVLRQPAALPLFTAGAAQATYTAISPMLGLTWQATPQLQWFANLSRSVEPPTGVEFHSSVAGILQAQRALTLEVGLRGQAGPARAAAPGSTGSARNAASVGWEFAIYHSRIRHELLGIESPIGSGRFVSTNLDATRHSGVEAEVYGRIPLQAGGDTIEWRLTYTYSRHRVAAAPAYVGNALPGIPPHFARFDLTYRHPAGWYVGPSLEFASSWYVDQANTLKAPGYGIVNATLGYGTPDDRWRVFVNLRNLGDKRYAATTDFLVSANGVDARVFNPGLSRAVYAGVQTRW